MIALQAYGFMADEMPMDGSFFFSSLFAAWIWLAN